MPETGGKDIIMSKPVSLIAALLLAAGILTGCSKRAEVAEPVGKPGAAGKTDKAAAGKPAADKPAAAPKTVSVPAAPAGAQIDPQRKVLVRAPQGEITAYDIPEGVTAIGDKAFAGCRDLRSVTIPAGVTRIGDGAFAGCTALVEVTFPAGLTEIGAEAFMDCPNLANVKLPEGLVTIGDRAFRQCSGIVKVKIPGSVTGIGVGAFDGCPCDAHVRSLHPNIYK